jgi:hypothetical protein
VDVTVGLKRPAPANGEVQHVEKKAKPN